MFQFTNQTIIKKGFNYTQSNNTQNSQILTQNTNYSPSRTYILNTNMSNSPTQKSSSKKLDILKVESKQEIFEGSLNFRNRLLVQEFPPKNYSKYTKGTISNLALPQKTKELLREIYKQDDENVDKINKLIETKTTNNPLELREYQNQLMDVLKDYISRENLRMLGTKFRELGQLSNKQSPKINRKMNRWERMINKISPFLPEYLVDKLKTQSKNY